MSFRNVDRLTSIFQSTQNTGHFPHFSFPSSATMPLALTRLHFFALICLLCCCFWQSTEGLDCFQQAATSVTSGTIYNAFTCPGNVNQCYKYVCVGSVYYVQKGCLDPQSPTQNCQVIQGQCQGQGGTGACYVCSSDRCNSATGNIKGTFTALALMMILGGFWLLFPAHRLLY